MIRHLLAVCMVAAIALPGCGEIAVRQKQEQLEQTLNAYQKTIRWGGFQGVAQFVPPQESAALADRDFAGVSVTSYDVLSAPYSEDGVHAQQTVRIRYYREDSAVEKTIVDRQQWLYEAAVKRWYLTSGVPAFQ